MISERKLKRYGNIFIEKIVDVVLAGIYFNLEAPSLIRHKKYLIENKVADDLETVNYQKIKRACRYLKQKGLIQYLKEKEALPIVTKLGEERLRSTVPFYDKNRIWDGLIYVISYDLPREKNKERDKLRKYLKKIGCGMLQQSLWITPYNPSKLILKFIELNNLDGELLIISSIGKDGAVGGMSKTELMQKVYPLSELNQKYSEFIFKFKEGNLNRDNLVFLYLSILKDDPQIPFSLLPDDWLGDEANTLFNKVRK